mmetsp:Transcript_36244/g.79336  ORF Transcript_36244/g.79336 Transcript_36244/m.79336 type:complete len:311 (+) Transcript_36244:182-1114(+)
MMLFDLFRLKKYQPIRHPIPLYTHSKNKRTAAAVVAVALQGGHGRLLNAAGLGLNDLINDTIIHSLLRSHEEITVTVLLNLILGLIAVFGNVGVEHFPNEQNFLGLNFNIGSLTLRPAERLMDHNARVGQRSTLTLGTCAEEEGAHTGRHTEAYGRYVTGNVLHGVIDGHTGRDGSAGTVDVESNVGLGIFVGQIEQLGNEDVGDLVVDALPKEEDTILEEAGDDVHLAALGIDDGHSDWGCGGLLVGVASPGIDLRLRLFRHHAEGTVGTGQRRHLQSCDSGSAANGGSKRIRRCGECHEGSSGKELHG